MSKKINYMFNEAKLDETTDITNVQLMRAGQYFHGWYGEFDITREVFESMVNNFDAKVRGVELAIDYFHESGGVAAGWIKKLYIKGEGKQPAELWAEVEWTPEGERRIREKELRYLSADFTLDYDDSDEKGQKDATHYGATLFGAGLTNRPFIKRMKKVLSEEKASAKTLFDWMKTQGFEFSLDFDTIVESLEDLTEDEKGQLIQMLGGLTPLENNEEGKDGEMTDKVDATKLTELTEQVTDLNKKLDDATAETTKLKKENAELVKDAEFNKLLAEGKAVPAQREAFMKGDVVAFAAAAKLSKDINLDETGKGDEGDEDEDKANADADVNDAEKAQDEVDEKAQTLMEKDTSLSYGDAAAKVLSENPKLKQAIYGA